MSGGTSSSTALQNFAPAYAAGSNLSSATQNYMMNQLNPVFPNINPWQLNKDYAKNAELAIMEGVAADKRFQPQVYAADQALQQQIANEITGGPDQATQNYFTKSGLMSALDNGTGNYMGGRGAGSKAAALQGFRELQNWKNTIQQKAAMLRAANPTPQTRMSAGDVANMTVGLEQNRANLQNQSNAAKAGLAGQMLSNWNNQTNYLGGAAAAQAANNVSARNQASQGMLGGAMGLVGSGIMAGGIAY